MEKVSAIVIHEHGQPTQVAHYESIEITQPKPDEVRVRMAFAPINPADINVLEGKYPVRPALPGTPGVEGVGIVEALGAEVAGLSIGDAVLLPHRFGTWRALGNAKALDLIRVPHGVPLEQAAMVRINPATALCMLREFVTLRPGDWVLQNAGNSAVGRCVVQIARHFGWRTASLVRRIEVAEDLRSCGADAVLLDDADVGDAISEATCGATFHLGMNAVGGDSALRIAGKLAEGGVLVTYGAMARQPLRIPNGMLIFQDIQWRGFWVTRWYEKAGADARRALFETLFDTTSTKKADKQRKT